MVVCAYSPSRLPSLRALIPAVQAQLTAGDELVLVIDHHAELLDLVRRQFESAADPKVRVLANDGERGLSGARNTGVRTAQGEVVVFLDDDAVPRAGWLQELSRPFEHPDTIGAGGAALPDWDSSQPRWFPDEFLWVVGCSYRGLPEAPTQIRNPIGANMAFRRAAFEAAGGFTDGIGRVGRTPLGCEETEFSIRATATVGGRIVQQPTAIVDHLVTAERARIRYFVHRCWAEGISKAAVSRLAGKQAALQSERGYATRTLPAGVARALWASVRGDFGALGRAGAIVAGLLITTAGYLRGTLAEIEPVQREEPATTPEPAVATPIWSGEIELSQPLVAEQLRDSEGRPFQRARLLVRAHGTPLGFVELETPGGRLETESAVAAARSAYAEQAASDEVDDDGWQEVQQRLVTVVLCTHDRAEGARRSIDSFRALRHSNLEIIVVDNAPRDDATRRLVEEVSGLDSRVRYVCEPVQGLSRARNAGLREANGEIIAFTDDDVRVDPLWVHGLLRGFARRPDVACVTGLVASSSLAHPSEQYFDQRVWWSSSCEHQIYTLTAGGRGSALHPYASGKFGTGANFAAETAVLRALGGFDQCLGAGSPTRGGEDLDIFVRVLTSGHAISYEPSALVWHDHRVDAASLRDQMYAYGLGLTAYLTKFALGKRSRWLLGRRIIAGSLHIRTLLRRSHDASAEASIESAGLAAAEARGMLLGPLAYLRARRGQSREHLDRVAP